MKARMTMVAVFLAAVMIAAAVIPAATGDTGNTGVGTDNDPRYIIGTADKAVEIADAVEAQIEFNRAAFSVDENIVTLSVAKTADTLSWDTLEYNTQSPAVATCTLTDGAKVTVTKTNAAEGIYNVKIESTKTFDAIKILIKIVITETFHGNIATQEFVWGAHVYAKHNYGAEIEVDGLEGTTIESISYDHKFLYEKSYSLGLSVKKEGKELEGYEFFATDLPKGLSVTSNKTIGGKLATDVNQSNGQFAIYAVLGGKVLERVIKYCIGEEASDFEYTVNDESQKDPEYAIIKTGESVTIKATTTGKVFDGSNTKITAKIWNGNSATNLDTNYFKNESNNYTTSATFTIDKSKFDLGTYKVDMTYHYMANGQEKTVTKSLYIFVVGNIYHADLDPAVTTTP